MRILTTSRCGSENRPAAKSRYFYKFVYFTKITVSFGVSTVSARQLVTSRWTLPNAKSAKSFVPTLHASPCASRTRTARRQDGAQIPTPPGRWADAFYLLSKNQFSTCLRLATDALALAMGVLTLQDRQCTRCKGCKARPGSQGHFRWMMEIVSRKGEWGPGRPSRVRPARAGMSRVAVAKGRVEGMCTDRGGRGRGRLSQTARRRPSVRTR